MLFIETESSAVGIKSSIWIMKLEPARCRCQVHHGLWAGLDITNMGISKQMILKCIRLALLASDIGGLGREGETKRGKRKTRRLKSTNERVSEKRK